MTDAVALHMPRECPCGGEYLLVRKDGGSGLSLMHKKPACAAYNRMTTEKYLAWVQTRDGAPPKIESAPAGPGRRQRRAEAARRRRELKRRGSTSFRDIRTAYEAALAEGNE